LPPLVGVICISVVVYSVIITESSIVFFLIGDFLYGCSGSYMAMSMSCFAYVADRTPAERRMVRITLLQLCMLVAGSVSPIAIGPLVSLIGVQNVVLSVIVMSVVNFAYVFLFLRNDDRKLDHGEPVTTDDQSDVVGQSYADDDRRDSRNSPSADDSDGCAVNTADHRHLPRFRRGEPRSGDNQVGLSHSLNHQPRSGSAEPRFERQARTLCDGVRQVVSLFLPPGRSRVRLNVLMAAFFVSMLPTFDMSLSNLFEMNRPLCWTVREVGLFAGTTFGICALGALIITPLMKRCLTDWHIAVTASAAAVVTNVYKFFVRDSLMMYFCTCFVFS